MTVPSSYPKNADVLRHCQFCGKNVIDPCMDETDLLIYSPTVDRCSDANFARGAELFYESEVGK